MTNSNKYQDIGKLVTHWIQGKHGRIGLVVPANKPTPEEMTFLCHRLAEIALDSYIRGQR